MELIRLKLKGEPQRGHMLRVTQDEAIRIVKSLSSQIISCSADNGREEFTEKNGEYFSISVHKEGV